ncbi:hypothetical protein P175DRAFT_0506413 [Aspergillus ochraceoroseus IBT 24754]|uniref:Uncharacterized protein n=2 Tax=Aspergillus ochraceoroseus TaxID=138278 RepID=A0A2T5M8I7_9EURO|nr:uncharacterized protein P175DRAFT_0506413 [Aspergillus ochraceoroseus IBT 24754]KKK23202.1 hypothetical protein AOCH_001891 [Aspergillus ochraceoroseus]PTU24842.1 hypothetical protein P175DRAFT_0506413 [Aspergillus ochraceoroseus IBT 24754]
MVEAPSLTRTKSRFESLPVEIIQEIFLRCLEINLPRASIDIARALSNPAIYTWLIRVAFSSTDKEYEKPFRSLAFLPSQIDTESLGIAQRRHLRSLILRCRWCTLPLMRQCQKEFIGYVLRSAAQQFVFSCEDIDLLRNIESRFGDLARYDRAQDGGHRGKGDIIIRPRLRQPPSPRYRISVWLNLGAVQICENKAVDPKGGYLELPFCEGSEIPDKLLSAPWTEAKLEFLELLSTKAIIDIDSSYSRATRALRQVIRDRDFATFERLLGLRVRVRFYRFTIPWPVLRVHFQAALKHADESDDPFIRLLVEKRWDRIPENDWKLKDKLLMKVGMNLGRASYRPC